MQTGEIRPARHTDLAFQIGGKLLRREVEIGAKVPLGRSLLSWKISKFKTNCVSLNLTCPVPRPLSN